MADALRPRASKALWCADLTVDSSAIVSAALRAWLAVPILGKTALMFLCSRFFEVGVGLLLTDSKVLFLVGNMVASFPSTFGGKYLLALVVSNWVLIPVVYWAPVFATSPSRRVASEGTQSTAAACCWVVLTRGWRHGQERGLEPAE